LVSDQEQERDDGKEWSAADIEDLGLPLKVGGTIECAAFFLCRAGAVEDVRRKAKELGVLGRLGCGEDRIGTLVAAEAAPEYDAGRSRFAGRAEVWSLTAPMLRRGGSRGKSG
jgi:hypothetical protein